MLLLLVQSLLRTNQPPSLLPLMHLESTRRSLEVAQRLVAQNDGLLDDVIEKVDVVGDENEGEGKGGEVALEPDGCFEVLG